MILYFEVGGGKEKRMGNEAGLLGNPGLREQSRLQAHLRQPGASEPRLIKMIPGYAF
jgi:hypothetical protein